MSNHSKQLIEIGKISRLHGYKGSVVVFTSTGKDSSLSEITTVWIGASSISATQFKIESASWMPKGWKLELEGVDSQKIAESLIGLSLYAERDSLPALDQNEFYLSDLLDLTAYDRETKNSIGPFIALEESSSDKPVKASYWVFETKDGPLSVPAVSYFIHSVDLKEKTIWLQNLQDLP